MKKLLAALLAAAMITTAFAGCASKENSSTPSENSSSAGSSSSQSDAALSGILKLSGSTSMEKVAKAWGEAFTAKNPDVTVDVQLGGSGAAVTNVNDGVSDIGNLSRALKDEEKNGLTENTVALDGIAVAVNPNNGVEDLTIDQLKDIFLGNITNWSELGGKDASIVVVGREAGSGTRDGFEEIVGVKDAAKYQSELNETGQVKNLVATNENAIGYVSLDYVDDSIKALKVGGVAPSEATVKDGSYTLQRPFLMVTKGEGSALAQAFLTFALSDEGQEVAKSIGCIPVN
ncbi:phosphate ABC transporter substrate-binding protein [Zongyangia hominis]|uniref:Phosphate-binding protein n=1 Tax=Zongyangia hominis TaxID=2763677 RepID=A0A926IBU7_9FIRM|nr:phosphate ABC transporter substrate-binding protein [Zongyangia hominis]MBC8570663.1 phosphate ABC transporter substrate-binding protein [Zongyangia hominis]